MVIIFTARIRRMREGNSFSLCGSSHLDGWRGGTCPTLPHPATTPPSWDLIWMGGQVPPIQVRSQKGGGVGQVPHPLPIQGRSQDGGQGGYSSPCPGQIPGWGSTPYWKSIACTCYTAGSMPLAFTQEYFLVE